MTNDPVLTYTHNTHTGGAMPQTGPSQETSNGEAEALLRSQLMSMYYQVCDCMCVSDREREREWALLVGILFQRMHPV